jgi:hypothetical protein
MILKLLFLKRWTRVFFLVIRYLVAPVLILFLIINTIGSIFLTSPLQKNSKGSVGFYNPYEWQQTNIKTNSQEKSIKKNSIVQQNYWKKISLHIHSNEVWYTPERQSLRDITQSYQRNGFEWISISDYNHVTDIRRNIPKSFLSYEWSSSLLKRHFLFVGISSAILDPFYFFSTRENIQWIINMHKKKNAFVVSNHPTLYDSMPIDFLANLSGVHAVEIFSPFGDDPKIMDRLLERGKPIFAMSADDLHYLPYDETRLNGESGWIEFWKKISLVYGREGQAFQRFIMVPNNIDSEESIYQTLCKGNYVAVRKFDRRFPDFQLNLVQFKNGKLKIAFHEKVREIRFITNSIKPIVTVHNVSNAEYQIQPDDKYVRAEVLDINGILTTNPVYRTEKMELRPNCRNQEIVEWKEDSIQ